MNVFFFAATLVAGMIGLVVSIIERPSAMDVYRGNTELKITGTYKDSVFVPTDSIVIFKINQYE